MYPSQRLLNRAFKKYCKEKGGTISIKKLAQEMEMPYSTVYNPLMERRRCNADTFLTMMEFFGCLEIQKSKVKIKS